MPHPDLSYYFSNILALVLAASISQGTASRRLVVLQTHHRNHQLLNPEIEGHSLSVTIQDPPKQGALF